MSLPENPLKNLIDKLRPLFKEVESELAKRGSSLEDRTLDDEVLSALEAIRLSNEETFSDLDLEFSPPQDPMYKAEKGRAAYDLLCRGRIDSKAFQLFINNKFGTLQSSTRNDITTYNNLLRLYLDIQGLPTIAS